MAAPREGEGCRDCGLPLTGMEPLHEFQVYQFRWGADQWEVVASVPRLPCCAADGVPYQGPGIPVLLTPPDTWRGVEIREVPEPAGTLFLLAGVLLLGILSWRKTSQAARLLADRTGEAHGAPPEGERRSIRGAEVEDPERP